MSMHNLARLALAATFAPLLLAQNPRIQLQSLDKLAARAAEVVDVNLEGPTLKMAAQFLDKDPETKAIIQGLTGIYVKVFQFEKGTGYTKADVDPIRAQLETPGWSRLVKVTGKKGEDVGVYALLDAAGNPSAMAIIAAEADELVFVNLVGPVDLKRLGALEGKLGIPKVTGGKSAKGKEEHHDTKD